MITIFLFHKRTGYLKSISWRFDHDKILIPSSEGRKEFHMPFSQAVKFVKDQCANKGKWAYLDGDYINPDTIDERALITAKEIMLANVLAGG